MTTADSQDASLAISKEPQAPLVTGTGGIVTSTSCAQGEQVISGSTVLTVNNDALILLATSQPLWRDLSPGDSGDDVASLQKELTRLGYRTRIDGRFGRSTLAAVTDLAVHAGARDAPSWSMLPLARVIWMPSPKMVVTGCSTNRGSRIDVGDPVATLPDRIRSAKVAPMPADLMPGRRVAAIGGLTLPLDSTGAIVDRSDLSRLGASDAYRAFSASTTAPAGSGNSVGGDPQAPTMGVALRLVKPLSVFSVPAGAVYDVDGVIACVVSSGTPTAVRIVGSQLGQTFVVPVSAKSLARVEMNTAGARSCR